MPSLLASLLVGVDERLIPRALSWPSRVGGLEGFIGPLCLFLVSRSMMASARCADVMLLVSGELDLRGGYPLLRMEPQSLTLSVSLESALVSRSRL